MSRSIDERVVQMKFDNKNFEKNVSESLGTLEKLKGSLDFDKSNKGLSNLQTSFDRFDVSSFDRAINAITEHFTFFGRISDQIIRRLADGFVDAAFKAKNMVTELSVGQIAPGWDKYEQKTSSVQTIMNATGKSIDEVNGYLDKLMWFSDETSYGFTDMTAALGQMTSSGGKIENLVPMIEGVANATAFAGKGASEFSRVMYNLNQSYASGALKYMDWKSLEMAGIASKQLKQTIIDTAVELGRLEEGQVDLTNFNDTLKEDWADQKVMEKAFGKFAQVTEEAYKMVNDPLSGVDTASDAYDLLAGKYDEIYYRAARAAQEAKTFGEALDATKDAVSSGWMKTFELIFGNYEEAKVLWTDMANAFWDIFASSAESRNELLEEWHSSSSGGYEDFVSAISTLLQTLVEAKEVFGQIVYDILPDIDTPNLQKFVLNFKDFSEQARAFLTGKTARSIEEVMSEFGIANKKDALEFIKLNDIVIDTSGKFIEAKKNGETFREAFAGIVHIVNMLRKVLVTLFNTVSPFFKLIPAVLNFIVKIMSGLGHLFGLFDRSTESTKGLHDAVDSFVNLIVSFLNKWGDRIYNFFKNTFQFDEATGKIKIVSKTLDALREKFREFSQTDLAKDLVKAGETIKNVLINIGMAIGGVITMAPEVMPYIVQGLTWIGEKLAWLGNEIVDFYSKAKEWVNNNGVIEWVKDAYKSVKAWLVPAGEEVKKFFSNLTFDNVKEKASGVWSFLKQAFEALKIVLAPVINLLKTMWGLISSGNFEGFKNLMAGLLEGGGLYAIFSLTKSGKSFKDRLLGIKDALDDFLNSFSSKDSLGDIILKIAIGIGILAVSMAMLSGMDTNQIANATIALGGLFGMLVGFVASMKALAGESKLGTTSRGGLIGSLLGDKQTLTNNLSPLGQLSLDLIKIAVAVYIFAAALKKLSKIDEKGLKIGLLGIGAILGMVIIFTKLTQGMGKTAEASSKAIDKGTKFKNIGKMVSSFAMAFLIIAAAILILSKIDLNGIKQGLIVLSVFTLSIIGIMAMASLLSEENSKSIKSMSNVIMSFAESLIIFSLAMLIISKIKWDDLKKGEISLAAFSIALIALIGITTLVTKKADIKTLNTLGKLMKSFSLALVIFSAALMIIGKLEWEDLGKGGLVLGAFAAALALLGIIASKYSVGFIVLGTTVRNLALALLMFAAALTTIALVGAPASKAIENLIRSILKAIRNVIGELKETVSSVIKSVCEAIIENLPLILDTLWFTIQTVLNWLDGHVEETIAEKIVSILAGIIKGIRKSIKGPDGYIAQLCGLLVDTVQALADWLNDKKNREGLIKAISDLVNAIVSTFFEFTAKLAERIPIVGADIAAALRSLNDYVTGQSQFSFKGSSFETLQTSDFEAAAIIISAGKGTDPSVLSKTLEDLGYSGYTKDTYNEVINDLESLTDEQRTSWINKLIEERSRMNPDSSAYVDYAIAQLKEMGYIPEQTRLPGGGYRFEPEGGLKKGKGLYTRDEGLNTNETISKTSGKDIDEPNNHPTGVSTIDKVGTIEEVNVDGDLAMTEKESKPSKETLDSRNNLKADYIIGSFESKVGLTIDSRFEGLSVKEAADKVGEIFATEGVEAGLAAYEDLTKNGQLHEKIMYPFFSEELKTALINAGVVSGTQYVSGVILGLRHKEPGLREAATSVANNGIIKPFKNTLQIASPSKVAIGLGHFWNLGLADGLYSSYPSILKATNNNANGMISTMSYAAGEMVGAFDSAYGEISNLESSVTMPINPAKNSKAISHLASVMDNQNRRAYKLDRKTESNNEDSKPSNYNTKNYGGFTINVTAPEGKDPSEWARYVMDEIQSEIERREAALA